MPHGQSLEFSGVTKRFGAVTAVAGLTARVEPGQVTGFLGPNGAGKTTTLRILLGLVRATDGHATIGGRRYAELDRPLQTVGAVLEASSFHPGRTAAAHLTIYAQAAGIPRTRVDEVLDLVGLTDAANRKVGGFSLGMRQRLGLAYALLGDPCVLVLDEPANGLDPEGIRWMRGFLRRLAAEGRTVLVSSHLLAEVQQTVDALLIISGGRLVFQGSIDELTDPDEHATVVDAPDRAALAAALQTAGVPFEVLRSGLTVRGLDPVAVGAAAAAGGVALSSLHRRGPALEEVFLDLVNGARVHASAAGGVGPLSQVPGTDAAAAGLAAGATSAGAATAVVTADPEPSESEPPAVADASPEQEDPGSHEAEQSALSTAVLDAQGTSAPGAAAALGAAAGAAWASEARNDEPAAATEMPRAAEQSGDAEAAEQGGTAEAAETASVDDLPPTADSAPTESAPPWYAVASTGVIDIVPAAEPEQHGEGLPEQQGEVAPEQHGEGEQEQPGQEFAPARGAEPAADWASDPAAIPADAEELAPDDPWAPEDSDPDVDALGEIDDELSAREPADADDDRPWEHYVKTDSDMEADAFFAAFDADGNPRVAPAPDVEPESEPESEPAAEADAPGAPDEEPVLQPEPESEPAAAADGSDESDTSRAVEPDAESEPASEPDAESEPVREPDAESEPAPESEGWAAEPGITPDLAAAPPGDEPEPSSGAEPEPESEPEPAAESEDRAAELGFAPEAAPGHDTAPAPEPEPASEERAPQPEPVPEPDVHAPEEPATAPTADAVPEESASQPAAADSADEAPEPAAPASDAASVPPPTDHDDTDTARSADARHEEGGDR
jgi:ABC-type multidrug transport system ATPase subunit